MSIDPRESAINPDAPHVTAGDAGRPEPAPAAFASPGEVPHDSLAAGAPFGGPPSPPFPQTLDYLLDVRISISVEVGRVQMSVRQVMELGPGAVVELQRSASEPVEIHANGKCIGRGEIVVVGEQFGVRITELGPAD